MAADLHCHTKLSDGSVGIEDLIVIAQKSGIDTIAITDHDCLAGTVRGKVIGKRYGVNVIPGVEISAIDNEAGKKVHILCYLADAPDRLEGLCKRTSIARKRARADYDAQGGRALPHYLRFYYFSRFRLHQPIQAAYYARLDGRRLHQ